MQTGGSPATPPPPEPVPVEQEPADATGKPVTNVYMLGEAADGLTQAALDVLAVLPALL